MTARDYAAALAARRRNRAPADAELVAALVLLRLNPDPRALAFVDRRFVAAAARRLTAALAPGQAVDKVRAAEGRVLAEVARLGR